MKTAGLILMAITLQAQAETSPIAISQPTTPFTPTTVITTSGTYVIVPNYTTGATQAIIQTSRAPARQTNGLTTRPASQRSTK